MRTLGYFSVYRVAIRRFSLQPGSFNSTQTLKLTRLSNRSLLKVSGTDSVQFLQDLLTNDVHLLRSTPCIYSHLLNANSRTLADVFLYRTSDGMLMDVDGEILNKIQNYLEKFKLRKNVKVERQDLNVWTVFNPNPDLTQVPEFPRFSLFSGVEVVGGGYDERLSPQRFGFASRFVSPSAEIKVSDQLREMGVVESVDSEEFRVARHRWGIAEGAAEMPPGKFFPLELNLQFHRGVSFTKGCYTGQELVARTHHTGVVRKRVMPLVFDHPTLGLSLNPTSTYEVFTKSHSIPFVGRHMACSGETGLALVRVQHARLPLVAPHPVPTTPVRIRARSVVPRWWPLLNPDTFHPEDADVDISRQERNRYHRDLRRLKQPIQNAHVEEAEHPLWFGS